MQYVWVILLLLPSTLSQSTGRFRVVVPDAHVFSISGSDVVLSCSVREMDSQNIMVNAVDLNVTWFRSDLKPSLVHLYWNHKDLNTDQNPSYRGRTAVFKEQLKNGDVSLKLSNIQPSDEGEYTCRVDSKHFESFKTLKLSVEAVGSEPVITVEKYESGKFSLLCESKGWRPKPELQWRNSKGVNLTAETETQAVADLFNVSSRITVEKIDIYFCSVTQRHHVKEGRIDAQTLNKHVPNPGKIVGITFAVLLLVGIVGVIFHFYNERRKRQKKINAVKRKEEEEINEVKSLLNSVRDGRLLHHDLSKHQWDYVEDALLNSEEDLKEFILRKYDPSDRGVQKLKKVIASSEKALLDFCGLTEKSCAVLADVLKSENSKLIELNLSENFELKDSGVEKLCDALKDKNCKLEKLRLAKCHITNEGFTALASALKENPSSPLKELDLSGNGLEESKQKLLELKATFPDLNVMLAECSNTDEGCAALASENPPLPSEEQDLRENGLKESEQKLLSEPNDTFV